ncbi:MAG: nuclear transport factor 2 family protein [Gammaproteobacteria bacterium]|nr:nuclear transport factor 2 family protein [Gammaproteobacteria bacterium]
MRIFDVAAALLAVSLVSPAFAQTPLVPAPVEQHAMMLHSDDPVLAANKKLVYDMYRTVLQAGQWSRAREFIAEGYIQHNPNVVSGRAALEEYIRNSRPAVEVEDTIKLPLISIIAERDRVALNFVKPEKDEDGNTYYTTWYDMFRIENGKIIEHWDPALKTPAMLTFNPNSTRMKQ